MTVSDKMKRCKAAADFNYKSVYHFGHANFEEVSPPWFSLPCAKKLGDPSIVLVAPEVFLESFLLVRERATARRQWT